MFLGTLSINFVTEVEQNNGDYLESYFENGLSISYDAAKKSFTFKDLVTKEIIVFEENK